MSTKDDNERGFFGIIIPKELLENKELSITEKVIFGYIASFRKACFRSNAEIADQLGVSESSVSHAVPKLEKMGYLFVEKDPRNNNLRRIYSVLENPKKLAYLASRGMWKNLCKTNDNPTERRQNLPARKQNLPTPPTSVTGKAKAKFADIDKNKKEERNNRTETELENNASSSGFLGAELTARPLRKNYESDEEWEQAYYKWNKRSI